MRAFVSGGAGFIGSHLVDRLIADANDVTVYDNLSSGKKQFISQHFNNPRFKFLIGDLLNPELLRKSMEGHDVVFQLAANPQAIEGVSKTRLDLEQNTIATYNVLESMRINSIRKVVFTSSGTVYGNTPFIPIREDYGPMLPISLYGASKLACEGLVSAFSDLFSIQGWIFRFGNIVGPRATHGVIFDLINKLKENSATLQVLGDGNQTKPYVYIDDCIDGLLFGFKAAKDKINVFNLAVSTVTSVREIVRILLEKTGHKETNVRYTQGEKGWPGDVPRVRLSTSKLEELGWKAKYTSHEAVAKTVDNLIHELWS